MNNTTISILIVDDEASVRDSVRAILSSDTQYSYAIETAATVEEARLKAPSLPQVVLLDNYIGDDSNAGLETLLPEILAGYKDGAPKSRVIIMTAHRNNESTPIAMALGWGASDFFDKPVKAETLLKAVHRAYEEWLAENRESPY